MLRRNAIKNLAAIAGLTALGGTLTACGQTERRFHAIDITGASYGQQLALPDTQGQTRSLRDFVGKVVVLFFGYVQCPDVCPTSLAELSEAKRLLGANGSRVQAVFVTVDPQRDTPAVLKAYMEAFDPSFVALRPTPEQLEQVTRDFRIFYRRVDGPTPTSYTVDHSAGSYIFDPKGRLRLYAQYRGGAQALADDIGALLDGA